MTIKDKVYQIRLWTRQGSNFNMAICDSPESVTEYLFTHGDTVSDELEREFSATYSEKQKVVKKLKTSFERYAMNDVVLNVRKGQEISSYIVDAWPLLTVSQEAAEKQTQE